MKSKEMLPKNAKRVFKGIIFSVYQWEQEMFDGTTKTFEAITRDGGVSVIPIVGDKILVNEEEQPYVGNFIDIPGGNSEEGETAEETAKRELLEETGYGVENLVEFYDRPYITPKILWEYQIFIGKGCKKLQEPQLDRDGEKITSKLLSFEEFIEEVEKPEFRNKILKNLIFEMKHTSGELEKFRNKLFSQ